MNVIPQSSLEAVLEETRNKRKGNTSILDVRIANFQSYYSRSFCGRGTHLLPRDRGNGAGPATLDVIPLSRMGIITYYPGMLD